MWNRTQDFERPYGTWNTACVAYLPSSELLRYSRMSLRDEDVGNDKT
jgi:hypothetical protein